MDKSLIPNTQIEQMFLRICTDEQMATYINHVDCGRVNLATAYASRLVTKVFFRLVEEDEKKGNK